MRNVVTRWVRQTMMVKLELRMQTFCKRRMAVKCQNKMIVVKFSRQKNIWERMKSYLVAIERRAAVAKIWPRRKRPAPSIQSRRRT